jgi:opacity protein-like surface antigen
MKNFFLLLLLLGFQEALGASAVIYKIFKGKQQGSVKIKLSGKTFPGDFYLAKFKGGNTCHLEILQIAGDQALLDLRICYLKNYLRPGYKLGDSLGKDADIDIIPIDTFPEFTPTEKDTFWIEAKKEPPFFSGINLSLGYSFTNTIDFIGNIPNPNTGAKSTIEGSFPSSGAPTIGVEYLNFKQGKFGYSLGADLQFLRNFDYASMYTIGNSYQGSMEDSKMWLGVIYLNLNFTLPHEFITYIGMNTSLPFNYGGDLQLGSQFGFQVGLSKVIKDKWIADLQYQWVNFRGGAEIPDNVVQFSSVKFNGFLLKIKYLFK